jgi:hypothetical protein
MHQLIDTTIPEIIPQMRFIATLGSTQVPVSYQPVSTEDAWARQACAANGFGDAIGIQPCTNRTAIAHYAYTRSGE